MSDPESLSAEDKAYFDTRGETTVAPEVTTEEGTTTEEVVEPITEEVEEAEETTTEDAGTEKPTGQSKVPLAALTKERNERKAIAAKLAETERKAAILEDRWNQALQRDQQPQPEAKQEAPALDLNTDPIGVVKELLTDLNQRKQSEAERTRQSKEQEAANEAWSKTVNVARSQYEAAASSDETFEPTYTALRANMGQEYMDLYGMTEAQARAEVDRYEAQQIAYAVDRGIDVAVHMRKLAKVRNISVAAKAEPKPVGEDLDKLAEGVSGSTSLSSAGGGRVASTSAQSIADMSPDEFGAWLSKNGADKFRKLAGG